MIIIQNRPSADQVKDNEGGKYPPSAKQIYLSPGNG